MLLLLGAGGKMGGSGENVKGSLLHFSFLENCIKNILGSYFQVREHIDGDC